MQGFDFRPARRGLGAAVLALALGTAHRAAAQPMAPPDSVAPPTGVHALGVRDLWAIDRISDPQPAPGGEWIAFVRRHFDVKANKGQSSLWLVAASGGGARRLTTAKANDSSPRWSPDGGTLAFLSDRSGTSQIWSLELAGGEPRPRTELPVDIESFQWSPDGASLAFAAEVYPDCETLACTKERTQQLEGNGVAARRYDKLLFRHWDTWESGRRKHLFVIPAAGGAAVDLLRGADLDTPPPPFGGTDAYDWSPDGKSIVFAGRARGAASAWTTDTDLYLAAADGSGFRCITDNNLAADAQPVFAPDGRTVAYLAMARPGHEADRERIVLFDVTSGARRILTEAWDRSPGELTWSLNGKTLYADVADEAQRRIYAIETATGKPRRVPHSGSATALQVFRTRAGERLAYVGESLVAPPEVWTCDPQGGVPVRCTDTNAAVLANVRMSAPQAVWFKGADSVAVHAWLLPPVDRREGEKYPLVLLVHGGPQGSWDDRFSFRWNPQVYAGAGYAVLAPDPRGSTGYGQAFTDGINRDWGGKAYEDLMQAVDQAVAQTPWIDGSRMAAAGASYGGYMIDWIAGHTDRFRCLVSHAGLFDLESFWGSTEEQWFPEWEFGGTPWEKPAEYARWSPSSAVQNWQTPMLVTLGGRDYRVPESQGFATFATLQRRGIPSEMIYFPTENHWILKPQNSILWHDAVLGWLGRWLAPVAPDASAH